MSDIVTDLRLSLARNTLGHSLYEARGIAFDLPFIEWSGLTPQTRERYREQAQAMLETVRPGPAGMKPLALVGK